MPDFGSPVAQSINPLGQGFSTLNELMNFRRGQQALQTGQYTQQSAQAEAQQAQQQNQELQALAQYTRSAATDPTFRRADGSLDVEKFQKGAAAAAPVYGQAYIGQATNNANAMIDNRKAMLGLSNEQRTTLGNYLGAVAAKPGATKEDFADAVEQARGVSDDPGYQRALDRMLMATPDIRLLPTDQASSAIRQHARGIAMETGAPNAAASAPAVEMVQSPGGLMPTNVNPQAPGGTGPVGRPIPNTTPPAILTPPGGIPTVVGPGGANPRQVPNSATGPNPTSQDWEDFGHYQSNLNSRVALASDSIPRIKQAEAALDQIRGGAGSEAYARLGRVLQAAGLPQSMVDAVSGGNLAAAQEAEKYLFQTTLTGLKQSLGGGSPYAGEANKAEALFPSIGTDPRASKAVLNFMQQQGQRDFAEQQALNKARKEGSFNPVTWQADYQQQLRAGKVPGVPESQVPSGAKTMPAGARLKAYADKYTGGDLSKAQEALRAHGYQ